MTRARGGTRRSPVVRGRAGAAALLLLLCAPAAAGCESRAVLRIGLASSREHLPSPRFVLTASDAAVPAYAHVLLERFPRDLPGEDPIRFQPVWRVDGVPSDPAPPRQLQYGQAIPGGRLVVPPAPLRVCERYVLSLSGPGTTSDGGAFQVGQDGAVLPFGARPPCPP